MPKQTYTREEVIELLHLMAHRKNKRNNLYKEAIFLVNNENISLGRAMKIKKGSGYLTHWEDSDSPTGYTQYCDWQGTCQYPCCGDC